MPTVMRIGSFRAVIYPNDHRPAHIHIIGPDSEAIFNLNCPNGPLELRESYNFSTKNLSKIEDALRTALLFLCNEWRLIHGD